MMTTHFQVLGPFGWPKHENGLPTLPSIPGVYLQTVKHQDGCLPYGVGITRRPVSYRFVEHTRFYVGGDYNILDVDAAQLGVRKVLWQGWGWTPEKRAEYEVRKEELVAQAKAHMSATHIFVIDMGVTPRLLERMEAAVANHFYENPDSLFDRGMLRMPRWEAEEPLVATLLCTIKLIGLPSEIEL